MATKRKNLHPSFEYEHSCTWRNAGRQSILSTENLVFKPLAKLDGGSPKIVEFELVSDRFLMTDVPYTRLQISGCFESKKKTDTTWDPIQADSYSKVMLAPDWFGEQIADITFFHGNSPIITSDVSSYINPSLDKYLLAMQNK